MFLSKRKMRTKNRLKITVNNIPKRVTDDVPKTFIYYVPCTLLGKSFAIPYQSISIKIASCRRSTYYLIIVVSTTNIAAQQTLRRGSIRPVIYKQGTIRDLSTHLVFDHHLSKCRLSHVLLEFKSNAHSFKFLESK